MKTGRDVAGNRSPFDSGVRFVSFHVEQTYHEDVGPPGPDGKHIFAYRYFLFRFTCNDGETLIARSYLDAPSEAHFLRLETTAHRPIDAADFRRPLFIEAVEYLRKQGKEDIPWLSFDAQGYVPVPYQPE
jgi:hypothetical protein